MALEMGVDGAGSETSRLANLSAAHAGAGHAQRHLVCLANLSFSLFLLGSTFRFAGSAIPGAGFFGGGTLGACLLAGDLSRVLRGFDEGFLALGEVAVDGESVVGDVLQAVGGNIEAAAQVLGELGATGGGFLVVGLHSA